MVRGVNIFHDDISAVFPRVMARFGCSSEYHITAICEVTIDSLINQVTHLVESIHDLHNMLKKHNALIIDMYDSYAQQALQSKFFMARENLRLALSMTHRSVHEYINFAEHDDSFCDDVRLCMRVAILHSGRYDCTFCQQAYSRLTHTKHVDTSQSHLQQDVNMLLKDMSQLSDCTLDAQESSIVMLDEHITANKYICEELHSIDVHKDCELEK